CYKGSAAGQDAVRAAFPRVGVWVTECSGTRTATAASTFADGLFWESSKLLIPSLQHGATAVMTWNLALDPSGGPHTGGCSTCTGVVTIAGGQATRNAEFYVLAHAARFVPRGSVQVASSIDNATFEQVAFRTPTGAIVVVLHQSGWQTTQVTVALGADRYTVPVRPWSLTTVQIAPR
ncbi:MAG: glucan endo-1,6-beta-glucosidase, partial [Cellulomonadaceae bacterium]|nr:glucan endo-1,6-beta-glucosidase [Cellulomonadaceae bacterium]